MNGELMVSDLSTDEAERARDALCRTVYSRLFTLLVTRINDSIKVSGFLWVGIKLPIYTMSSPMSRSAKKDLPLLKYFHLL